MLARRMDRLCVADFICRSLSYAYYTKKNSVGDINRESLELESWSWRDELELESGIGDLRILCGNSYTDPQLLSPDP
jgi:hypothetical protein